MRRAVVVVVVAGGLALVVGEAAMRPSPAERVTLYGLFSAASLLAGIVGWWLPRVHRRLRSLRWTILLVAVAAAAIAAGVVAGSAATMILAPPDVRLVLGALALGTVLAVLVALGVTGPLTTDLRRLAAAAGRVADGDLQVRTGIARQDEVGDLAVSLERMVDQLARLESEREQGERARRRLLASIGHDLRTPLASMRAAIEALQDGIASDPERYLRTMAADVELLRSMVEDLFVLARLEAGDLHLERIPVDLSEIAEGALEAAVPVAERRGVSLCLTSRAPAPTLGDPQALDRVLRNLLDNAIRHAPRGSTVHVGIDADGETGTVRVRDEGQGFDPRYVERAFEAFSRADASRERHGGGAGLGLAIARQLVDAHAGTIWIEPGRGATVAFRLPLTTDRDRTTSVSERQNRTNSRKTI